MAYRELIEGLKGSYPSNTSQRYRTLDGYERLLNGTIYEHLAHSFETEKSGGQYIPIRSRRPSVKYNLARIVVDEVAALTFGEAHFPTIKCWEPDSEGSSKNKKRNKIYAATERAAHKCVEAWDLEAIMMDAVVKGSIGSCALIVRALPSGHARFDIISGKNCRPLLDITDPLALGGLARIYRVSGEELQNYGYEVDPTGAYWIKIDLTDHDEVWYYPLPEFEYENLGGTRKDGSKIEWKVDDERTGPHGFDVVPAVWVTNLISGGSIDGPCTFGPIVDICVALDYLLSQMQRGLHYSMDPLLAIKRGELLAVAATDSGNNQIVKSASQVLDLGTDGDAKLLEITGNGFAAAKEFAKMLREYALEVIGGMKSDQEHAGGPQSGRALELLHQALVWLVERKRISYGNQGLTPLIRILLGGLKSGLLKLPDGQSTESVNPDAPLRLDWPAWWVPRGSDLRDQVAALQMLAGGSEKEPVQLLQTESVARIAAKDLDLSDPMREVEMVEAARQAGETVEAKRFELQDKQVQGQIDAQKASAAAKKTGDK